MRDDLGGVSRGFFRALTPRSWLSLTAAIALLAFWQAAGPGGGPTAAASPRATLTGHLTFSGPADWTVYHHDALGSGVDTSGVSFDPAIHAWTTALDADTFGEPLEATGRVFVATLNDTVYALAANTGSVLWSSHLGTPVPQAMIPCNGDISPVGIVSTPVIDTSRAEIFVVADELVNGAAEHVLYGLSIYSGTELLAQPVDPPEEVVVPGGTEAILNRASLTIDEGQVVFGYGGNDGDCGPYHGWIVAVPEGGGPMSTFEVDSQTGNDQGAVWMGGAAPLVDNNGNVWFADGNGSVGGNTPCNNSQYDDSDGVLELNSSLMLQHFFAPSDWCDDNQNDRDLGSVAPAMLSDGYIVQGGKSQTAYLLNQANLGQWGGQVQQMMSFCGSDIDGGPAVQGSVVYLPCQAGIVALSVSPPTMTQLWQQPNGVGTPPILASGHIWAISGNHLDEFSPANGVRTQQLPLAAGSQNHFPTPSVGDGLLLADAGTSVEAYAGPAGLPGPPSPPPPAPPGQAYWTVASDGGVFSFGNIPYYGSMGGKPLVSPVVGIAATPDGHGYWEVAADGGLFAWGDATYAGSMGGKPLVAPVVGMAPMPDGHGYWDVAADGGLFNFGDAGYFGSMGGRHLNAPVVGIAATADGGGYWEVASDGGIFNFGDACYYGSMGGKPLDAAIVGIVGTPDGRGYWEVASDGGIFNFGDAGYFGSMGGKHLNSPVVGIAAAPDGGGYWEVASDGGIFNFGDAGFNGSMGGLPLVAPMVGITPLLAG